MNFFTKIKVWFGLAEVELSHLVSEFHSATAKLHNFADRKFDEASKLAAEIAEKTDAKDAAQKTATEARVIAGKIKELVTA